MNAKTHSFGAHFSLMMTAMKQVEEKEWELPFPQKYHLPNLISYIIIIYFKYRTLSFTYNTAIEINQ